MHPEPTNTRGVSPIDESHVLILHESAARFKKVQKAIKYAGFNGGTMLFFGVISLLTGLGDIGGMAIGAALTAAGFLELRQRAALRRLEASALPRLAINQGFVALAITAYCLCKAFFPAENEMMQQLSGAGGDTGIDMEGIARSVEFASFVGYLVLAGLTIFFQLLAVWFYLSKREPLARYLRESPEWVHDLQRRGLLKAA